MILTLIFLIAIIILARCCYVVFGDIFRSLKSSEYQIEALKLEEELKKELEEEFKPN